MKERVLILCAGNSAPSQMAEGLLEHDAGDRFEAESAGTKPGRVRPEAITVMKELGIDISGHRSKHVDEFQGQSFDYNELSGRLYPRLSGNWILKDVLTTPKNTLLKS
jgi:arsenate reductase (thioredoxin)